MHMHVCIMCCRRGQLVRAASGRRVRARRDVRRRNGQRVRRKRAGGVRQRRRRHRQLPPRSSWSESPAARSILSSTDNVNPF